jgi:PadR family transcriptional regulator PadR
MSTQSHTDASKDVRRPRASEAPPRLSGKEAIVLELLHSSEQYGLEIVRLSEGRLKRGTVYTTLNRMQQKGYVQSHSEEKPSHVPGIPRRLFRATPYGLRLLEARELATNFLLQEAPA